MFVRFEKFIKMGRFIVENAKGIYQMKLLIFCVI